MDNLFKCCVHHIMSIRTLVPLLPIGFFSFWNLLDRISLDANVQSPNKMECPIGLALHSPSPSDVKNFTTPAMSPPQSCPTLHQHHDHVVLASQQLRSGAAGPAAEGPTVVALHTHVVCSVASIVFVVVAQAPASSGRQHQHHLLGLGEATTLVSRCVFIFAIASC
jgi:hypothetical protein